MSKKLIRTEVFPYHVTSRSNNREWFNLPLSQTWNLCIQCLIKAHERHPFKLYAFVLMNNHYHLLIKTPDANLDKVMFEFNRRFSEKLRIKTNRINRMFGGPYKRTIVDNDKYFRNVIKYIYQNPIRSKTHSMCEDYPYSTLFFQYNNLPFPIPIETDLWNFNLSELEWLNQHYNQKQSDCIKKALKKKYFKPGKDGPIRPLIKSN